MSNDFIPPKDDEFAHFITTLNTGVTLVANPLHVPTATVTAWLAGVATWGDAWEAWTALAAEIRSKLEAKDNARAALEPLARQINAGVQADPTVDDATRALYDLPVHKTSRTPAPVPTTAPLLLNVDQQHLLQRLHWVDSATPGSKAKPAGVRVCEIWHEILPAGAPAPTNPEAMDYIVGDSKTPYRYDFDAADLGKTAWYALRWINTRNEPGPWSAITGYPVT